ncbi:hypothetical protein HanIR_Chr11g0518931 [Helianthus annuus]|nr:hypothetical protein HanIR_Chr11g0518931 [Helianthus annuus]
MEIITFLIFCLIYIHHICHPQDAFLLLYNERAISKKYGIGIHLSLARFNRLMVVCNRFCGVFTLIDFVVLHCFSQNISCT